MTGITQDISVRRRAVSQTGLTHLAVFVVILIISILALAVSGCLYRWHSYGFDPKEIERDGFRVFVSSGLLHSVNGVSRKVNGAISDSTGSYWDIEWRGNVDDTLRSVAHLESDSVSVWASGGKDTLNCDSVQDMTRGRWAKWVCGRISYRQLNSRDIQLRMIIRMIFSDGRSPRRFELIWTGKQKAKWIHSDY